MPSTEDRIAIIRKENLNCALAVQHRFGLSQSYAYQLLNAAGICHHRGRTGYLLRHFEDRTGLGGVTALFHCVHYAGISATAQMLTKLLSRFVPEQTVSYHLLKNRFTEFIPDPAFTPRLKIALSKYVTTRPFAKKYLP